MSEEWYQPGKSLAAFHESLKFVRVIIGGRGSGKTTTVAVEVERHALHTAGAKILILRKTEASQSDTTIDTFGIVYKALGALYEETETSLFKSINGGKQVRLPSLVAIEKYNAFLKTGPNKTAIKNWLSTEGERWCATLEFRGLPDAKQAANKLRGYECSMMVLIEADLMTRADLDMGMACMRWKDAYGNFIEDTCIIIDSNPPSPRHWIAKLEEEVYGNGREIPPDKLMRERYEFWHIPTRENIHNLPPNYVENLEIQYRNNPSMYKRMLLGEYAEAFDGAPVYTSFYDHIHGHDELPFPRGAYLVRGWDFGNINACIFNAYFMRTVLVPHPLQKGQFIELKYEYWWVLSDLLLEDSGIEDQCIKVKKHTVAHYPFWNDRSICAGVYDFCDPAGDQNKDTGKSVDVMRTHGYNPGFQTQMRSLPITITICNRLLEKRDETGKPQFRIDRINANRLYVAILGGYRYPNEGEAGYKPDKQLPLKGPQAGGHDHPPDAWRYAVLNCMKLAKEEFEKLKPSARQRTTKVNPKRIGARVYSHTTR